VSASAGDRRRVLGGILLAVAGAYILFQPFGGAPATCVGSLGRIVGSIPQGISMCVAGPPVLSFVLSSLVGVMSIIAALWMLLSGTAGSRTVSWLFGAVAVAVVGAGIVAVVTSPSGPFRTFAPTQTALPVQTSAPTARP
jgi:hypothetical protein